MADKTQKKPGWFKGLKAEFGKVVWPDKKSLAKESTAVIVISVILGALISIIDVMVKYGIDLLVK